MLFTVLLCSFVIGNTAVRLSLQPAFESMGGTERSLVSQILKHNNNAKSDHELIDLVDKLDPEALTRVIYLVGQMRFFSEQDLTRITATSTNADNNYTYTVRAHNAAIVAKSTGDKNAKKLLDDGTAAADKERDDGISNLREGHTLVVNDLQTTYNEVTGNLQSAVDTAIEAQAAAKIVKDEANAVLHQEKARLDNEIASLDQVLGLLNGIIPVTASPTATGFLTASPTKKLNCVTTGGNVPDGTPCSFPFTYHGYTFSNTYNKCTDYMNNGKPWCSTEPDYNNGKKKWGNCVCR